MNKNKHLPLLLALLPMPTFAQSIQSDTVSIPMPDIYGDIRAQGAWHQDRDYTTDIYQASIGAIGFLPYQALNVRYHLEAEYSESDHNVKTDKEIILREANLIALLKGYGGMYIGTGTTGTWEDLYRMVDIFESNSMERASDNLLFGGKRYASNQLALISPKVGDFQFKAAVVTPNDNNDNDADIIGLRALYNNGNYSLVVNHSWTDKAMLPSGATQHSQRTVVSSSYRWDNFYLAGLAEFDFDAPYDERQVYGLSARYNYGNTAFSMGFQYADWDNPAIENETLTLANVRHDLNDHLAIFVEGALYGEDKPDTAKGDNINLGLIASF